MITRSAVLVLLAAGAIPAQSVTGRVYDRTGAVVSGARVMLMDQDYMKQRETRSGDKGEFSFASLKPGLYFVQVKQNMFQLCQQHVKLEANQDARVYMVLTVGRGLDEMGISASPAAGVPPDAAPAESLRAGGKVEMLRLIKGRPPQFPPAAAARGAGGQVAMFATVKVDGTLADVIALGPADPELAAASVAAVANWRYQPMKLDGVPVETGTLIVFKF